MHGYLFEVMYDEDGPSVIYGMDVSGLVSDEYREEINKARTASKAAKRIGVEAYGMERRMLTAVIKRDGLEDGLNKARPMFLRSQITGIPLYLIKTEDPMTFDEITDLLRRMNLPGELRAFLEKAKV